MTLRLSVLIIVAAFMSASMLAATAASVRSVVDAAERGDTVSVRKQLRSGADVNETHADGMTALHWAAEHGDVSLTNILIYAGANIGGGTRIGGYTPLHIASRHGHPDVVKALLDARADVNVATSNSGVMPLHLAAASSSPETVRTLLDTGTDVNAVERAWGQTPLIFAASANRLDIVKVLLAAGADHSATSRTVDVVEMERGDQAANKRLTAILAAFKEQAGGGADWLPQPTEVQGAIVFSREIQRNWPNVPDPACEERGDAAASQFSRAALPDTCNEPRETDPAEDKVVAEESKPSPMSYGEWVGGWGGLTPLLHAVRQGHDAVVAALLEAGADIDQPSGGDSTTPLLMAAVNGQFDLVLDLLRRGADPNKLSNAGTGPLFAVLERQWAPWAHYAHPVDYQDQNATHLDVVAALLDAGADPNIRLEKHLWYAEFTSTVLVPAGLHYDGATPFWRAAQALDVNAMRLLKEYGADTKTPTRKIPKRKRSRRDPKEKEEEEVDHSGLPPVPFGGPFVYPIHVAAGAGYGNYFMAHAHRHVPDNWMRTMRYLVEECGGDVNIRDGNGYTPLHHAAARGDNEMIEYLIRKGADIMVVSRKGQTIADMANGPAERISPFPATIELLVGLGAINNNQCVSC